MRTLGKRFLAAILAAAMLLTTAGVSVCAVETEENAVASEMPEISKGTEKTGARAEEKMNALEASKAPGQENVSEGTKAPGQANVQEGTEIPGQADVPEGTKAPGQENVSEGTEAPGQADVPEGTGAPGQADVPEATDVPESSGGSDVTEKPGASDNLDTMAGGAQSEQTEVPGEMETQAQAEVPGEMETQAQSEIPAETQAQAEVPEEMETQTQPEIPAESELAEVSEEIEQADTEALEKMEFYALNDKFEVDGIIYKELGGGRVRLMDGQKASGNLVIPERVVKPGTEESYQVVSIEGRAFASNKNLTGITLPQSVTSIGNYAFASSGISGNLVLPEGLCELGDSVFEGCTGLTGGLKLPESLTRIGEKAFSRCTGLTGGLTLPANLPRIEHGTFDGCTGLTGELKLPAGLTAIESYAFLSCTSLTPPIVLPDGLTTIGQWAFPNSTFEVQASSESVAALAYAAGYKNITLNGATYKPGASNPTFYVGNFGYRVIDEEKGYVELTSADSSLSGTVTVPKTITHNGKTYMVTSIGSMAFMGRDKITGINLPNGLLHIGDSAFDYLESLKGTLTLPDSLLSIGDSAFRNCTGLTGNLVLPKSLKSIGKNAFFKCTSLNGTLTLPEGLEQIGKQAFFDCNKLCGNLTLPDTLTRIGQAAFENCSGFTGTLVIPDSVLELDDMAFQSCTGFSQFEVGKGLQRVGSSVFPSGAKVIADSPRVQLLLVEYLNANQRPDALWDGQEDVPDGAIAMVDHDVTIDSDVTIYGDITVKDGVTVTIAPGAKVHVTGSLKVDGTVKVEGILTSDSSGAGDIIEIDDGKIIKRQQNLTITAPGSKTYGDPAFTLALEGGMSAGAVTFTSSDPSVLSISQETATIHKTGSVTIQAVKPGDYTFADGKAELTVVIKPKKVSFRADSITVKKDEAIPSYTYTCTGLAYADQIETEPVLTCSKTDSSTVGEYPIEISGAVLTNQDSYEVEYIPGILKIAEEVRIYHYSLIYSSSADTKNMPADQIKTGVQESGIVFTIGREVPDLSLIHI